VVVNGGGEIPGSWDWRWRQAPLGRAFRRGYFRAVIGPSYHSNVETAQRVADREGSALQGDLPQEASLA
jgi:hypothetical protein